MKTMSPEDEFALDVAELVQVETSEKVPKSSVWEGPPGEIWISSDSGRKYVWDGSDWVAIEEPS